MIVRDGKSKTNEFAVGSSVTELVGTDSKSVTVALVRCKIPFPMSPLRSNIPSASTNIE